MKLEPLDPELRSLLDAARRRDADDPSGDAGCEQLLARVETAVREASERGGQGLSWSTMARRQPVALIACVCVLSSLAAIVIGKSGPVPSPLPSRTLGVSKPPSSARPEPSLVPTLHVDDLPSSVGSVTHRPVAPPTSTRPSASGGSALAEEIRLIDAARGAMAAKDPARALRLVREHERRFPDGQLVQERERIHIHALDETGHPAEARERTQAFRARFPSGLLLPSVERSADAGAR